MIFLNFKICYTIFGDYMKRFTMKNENFTCENCRMEVSKASNTARDHCPYCLYSKHLDILPGDRKNTCHGLMEPIGIEKFKNTFKILYKCQKCGDIHKNIANLEDNMDLLITLSIQK